MCLDVPNNVPKNWLDVPKNWLINPLQGKAGQRGFIPAGVRKAGRHQGGQFEASLAKPSRATALHPDSAACM